MSSDTKHEDLRAKLSPIQYAVTQEASTEAPFTGAYWDHHGDGTYRCVVCGEPLFDSGTKFESGTGWPSFYDVVERGHVTTTEDRSLGMRRTEVTCSHCGSPRPPVPGRPAPDGHAVLHQLGGARLHAARRPGVALVRLARREVELGRRVCCVENIRASRRGM